MAERRGTDREGAAGDGQSSPSGCCVPQEPWHTGPIPVESGPGASHNTHASWPIDMPLELRIQACFEEINGCWVWQGYTKGRMGYASISVKNRDRFAHRISYELANGAVPDGLVLDHLCRNVLCVNPDHLEPVTNKENILRGSGITARSAKKTHCPAGHPYTDENTARSRGRRICKTCAKERG